MGSKGRTKIPTAEEIQAVQSRHERIKERLESMSPTMWDMRNHEIRLRAIEQQLGIPSPSLKSLRRRIAQRGDDDYA